MIYVFRTEVATLRTRIERLRPSGTSEFLNAAFGFLGIGVGALVALVAFYHGSEETRSRGEELLLWAVAVAGFAIAGTSAMAAWVLRGAHKTARDEIVEDIKRIEYHSPSLPPAVLAEEPSQEIDGESSGQQETPRRTGG